jgi:tetratricopeptide (TPR) repeat protein
MAPSLWGTTADRGTLGRAGADGTADVQRVVIAIGNALMSATSPQERARLRHRLGYLALLVGDVRTKALEAFTMMRDGALAAHDRQLEALADNGLAIVYDFIGQRHQALQYAQEAEQIAEELGDQRMLALALNNQAQFYKENGQNQRAFELFKRVEAIGQALNDEQLVMGAYIGMGRTTSMAAAFTAIGHYEKAIEMAKAIGDEPALIVCYNNLSDWMINTGRYQEAIALREECLHLSRKLQSRPGIGRALIGMAKAYTLMGELDKARVLLNQGFPTVLSAGDLEGDLHSSLNLAYLYVQSGDIARAAELYRTTLERSLAAPDHACALFAQKALELLADGQIPAPAILPPSPVSQQIIVELTETELDAVVGGVTDLRKVYPTGDLAWHSGL